MKKWTVVTTTVTVHEIEAETEAEALENHREHGELTYERDTEIEATAE